ncbi:aldose 1-epimerase family protein [Algibacter amylolyticus]|uniref:Aldose 1-epimerase family protein n=1 Tax=Algibacter amylolyticus TaxID=1608400 RepID=A0A5M7B0P1_9FLAO|nr:aldose 1-epimerase family protein [Algibacter amylolyticus]KAA5822360.1 aldose 1-epimerase family protein [Algibacter amylolyticus]MBB5269078.1 galactose mutarotase-like enzyme [Algibacter amylolyticus]TSJ73510.1 aldose 1-epimerase family protein [Algibacter amylolyticus]
MYSLENNILKIDIKKTGAELCGITGLKNNIAFMWHADPDIWGSYAPNLFPIIGALKDNTYIFEDHKYELPKHGFIRNNEDITLLEQTKNSITFKLVSNNDLIKKYPFNFEFLITYTLTENTIEVKHSIKNLDDNTMYFSVGGHPAFKCPVYQNENYEDYSFEFEHTENSKTHLVNMENGLITANTEQVFDNSNKIELNRDIFKKDALIFKDLKSKKVTLKSANHGPILTVSHHDFDYLGLWAKPNGDYVCIEPWLGIADSEDTNQNLIEKEGIISLAPNKSYQATYSIEIHNSHLV